MRLSKAEVQEAIEAVKDAIMFLEIDADSNMVQGRERQPEYIFRTRKKIAVYKVLLGNLTQRNRK